MSNQLQIALIAHRADLKSASPQGKNWVDTLQRNMALRLQQLTACSVNIVVLEPQAEIDTQWNDTNSEPFDVLLPLYSMKLKMPINCAIFRRARQFAKLYTSNWDCNSFWILPPSWSISAMPRAKRSALTSCKISCTAGRLSKIFTKLTYLIPNRYLPTK